MRTVGWVERSETQQRAASQKDSYKLTASSAALSVKNRIDDGQPECYNWRYCVVTPSGRLTNSSVLYGRRLEGYRRSRVLLNRGIHKNARSRD